MEPTVLVAALVAVSGAIVFLVARMARPDGRLAASPARGTQPTARRTLAILVIAVASGLALYVAVLIVDWMLGGVGRP